MFKKIRSYFRRISIWTTLLNSIQICVYIVGIGLVVLAMWKLGTSIGNNTWPPSIEKIGAWAQIVIAYAAVFAIGQYAVAYADIADRKTKTVLEFVKFFRESVLEKVNDVREYTNRSHKLIPIILLRKNTPAFKFTEEEFFRKIAPNQKEAIDNYIKLTSEDFKIQAMILSCLNAAEEFSIGVLNSKSQDHKAVSSIKKPFVEIIEQLAVPLYFQIGMMSDQFSYTSELYGYWKKDVGFSPQVAEDRTEKYTERGKKYKKN